MRVATYARVSTVNRDQKPEIQTLEMRRYCKSRGWKITHEITDRASGKDDKRPGLLELIRLAQSREIDTIVILKLDRLFRSLKHLVNTLSDFEALGVKLIATRDQVDLTTPSGRLFVQMLGSLAEFERELIRERIMLGLEHAKAQGKHLGRPKVHDDKTIRKLRKEGLSYQAIQRKLGISKGAVWRALT